MYRGSGTPLPYFKLTSYADMGGAGGGASFVRDSTYQVYDNWSYQIGRHLIKVGTEYMLLEYVPITAAQRLRRLPVLFRTIRADPAPRRPLPRFLAFRRPSDVEGIK